MSLVVLLALSAIAWQDAVSTPSTAAVPPSEVERIAAEVSGEPDPCVRRESHARDEVERFQRDFPKASPEDLENIRRLALEMFQASADMAYPQGSPPPDFAVACAARDTALSHRGQAPQTANGLGT